MPGVPTPLHLAARRGEQEVLRHLLDYGADIDAQDVHGDTALSWARLAGHQKVVDLLLERGADAKVNDTEEGSAAKV